MFSRLGHSLFGVYAAALFVTVTVGTVALMVVIPRTSNRRRTVRRAAASLFLAPERGFW